MHIGHGMAPVSGVYLQPRFLPKDRTLADTPGGGSRPSCLPRDSVLRVSLF